MSDLYDSLEDDSDGNENSRDFLNRPQDESSGSFTDTYKCDSVDKYSFFLNSDKIPQKQKLDQLFFYNKPQTEEGKVLPEIKNNNNNEKGLSVVSNLIVDNVALNEKGLQLNKDGSFTRSPRVEEELPFIAREYKNLKFQKKKTYLFGSNKQKSSGEKINLKQNEISREMLPASENSSVKSLVPGKQFQPKHNMTDSMKERLLRSFEGNKATPKKYDIRGAEQNGKLKRNDSGTKEEREFEGKRFLSQRNILPNLNTTRPRLNYSERRQLENGFNPFCLRQEGKGVPEDSNRSNYGDSVQQDLPEISSRVVSYENLLDSEEEMFYKKIIQKEKAMRETPRTCRSDGPVESFKLNGIVRRNSFKDGLESTSRKNNSRNSAKSTFIDMPAESNHSETNSRRFSHYCSSNNTSRNASKVELALKARTYGYLVNARNIFKLKAQSERKFNALEKGKNEKSNENSNSITPSSLPLSKQHSLPTNCFKTVKETLIRNLSKQSVSPRKPKFIATKGSTRDFVLPQVTNSQFNHKLTPEMFSQISSCLKSE